MKYRLSFVLSLIFVLVFVISAPLSASAFSDVDDNSWYADAVDYCYEKGYFAGTSATTFSPDLPMDRSMLVTVLHRREGTPQPTTPASFSDVPADTWYSEAVAWAAEEKIVSGYEDGTFRPEKPITRQEIMSLFQRYVVYLGEDASSEDLRIFNSFLDCSLVGEWATPAAQWCTSVGIICGSNGYISPTSSSTRAQIASILMRLDSYLDGKMQTITSTYGEGGTMVPLGTFQIVENSSISFRVTADQGWIQKTATLNGTTLTNQQIYTVYGKDNPQTIVVTFRKLAGDPYSGYGQLVNRSYPIPNASSYKPSDLKTVAYGNVQLRAEAANALNRMIADYRAENPGSTLYAQSGYRSNSTQVYLYNRQINRQGGNVYKAGTISAVPGTSEHELGLAVDLTYDGSLEQSFGSSRQGKWLEANCMDYGFILRYPADKERIVGIIYEPWHFRYVGTDITADMKALGVTTLEEYYGLYLSDSQITPYLPYLK